MIHHLHFKLQFSEPTSLFCIVALLRLSKKSDYFFIIKNYLALLIHKSMKQLTVWTDSSILLLVPKNRAIVFVLR